MKIPEEFSQFNFSLFSKMKISILSIQTSKKFNLETEETKIEEFKLSKFKFKYEIEKQILLTDFAKQLNETNSSKQQVKEKIIHKIV